MEESRITTKETLGCDRIRLVSSLHSAIEMRTERQLGLLVYHKTGATKWRH